LSAEIKKHMIQCIPIYITTKTLHGSTFRWFSTRVQSQKTKDTTIHPHKKRDKELNATSIQAQKSKEVSATRMEVQGRELKGMDLQQALTHMDFPSVKNSGLLGVAFTHRFVGHGGASSSPANPTLLLKGNLTLKAAVIQYLFLHYPKLTPKAMEHASQWFISDLALARYARELQFHNFLLFDPRATEYSSLKPEERLNVLSTTYKCLMGTISEEYGLKEIHPLVSRQVKWVESLKIKHTLQEEEPPVISKKEQKKQQMRALMYTDSLLQPKTGNLPNWLQHSISLTISKDPRDMAEEIFVNNDLGNPIYQMVREVGRNTKDPIFLMGAYDKSARLVGQGLAGDEFAATLLAAKNAIENILGEYRELKPNKTKNNSSIESER